MRIFASGVGRVSVPIRTWQSQEDGAPEKFWAECKGLIEWSWKSAEAARKKLAASIVEALDRAERERSSNADRWILVWPEGVIDLIEEDADGWQMRRSRPGLPGYTLNLRAKTWSEALIEAKGGDVPLKEYML
jgi:hypothetical protein